MFSVFEIIAFEHVSGISLNYDENIYGRQSTCYETVLRLHIWLKKMFCKWICLGLMENEGESGAVLVSAVIVNREHLDSGKVF